MVREGWEAGRRAATNRPTATGTLGRSYLRPHQEREVDVSWTAAMSGLEQCSLANGLQAIRALGLGFLGWCFQTAMPRPWPISVRLLGRLRLREWMRSRRASHVYYDFWGRAPTPAPQVPSAEPPGRRGARHDVHGAKRLRRRARRRRVHGRAGMDAGGRNEERGDGSDGGFLWLCVVQQSRGGRSLTGLNLAKLV